MHYFTLLPSEKLAGHVRFFWVLESEKSGIPYIHRSMAGSSAELIFHYRGIFDEIDVGDKSEGFFLSGIHSQSQHYRRFITCGRFGIFGVHLYPYAARQLFGLNPGELTNHMPDLQSALGRSGTELEEQVMLASDNRERYQIVSEFLESRLSKSLEDNHPVRSAVRYLIHSKRKYTVEELAYHFNISERQFVRKFKEYSGFGPKLFMRIIRFEEACRYYGGTGQKSLTEIAHECGYYDQSHFIHDFKAFSGYNPYLYFKRSNESNDWLDN